MATKKPFLGVKPRQVAREDRFEEIREAMLRHLEAGQPVKHEWVEEYNELEPYVRAHLKVR